MIWRPGIETRGRHTKRRSHFRYPFFFSKPVSLTAWESDAEELKAAGRFLSELSQVRKKGYKLHTSNTSSELVESRAHLLCETRVTSNFPFPMPSVSPSSQYSTKHLKEKPPLFQGVILVCFF